MHAECTAPSTPVSFITWVVVQYWNLLKSCFSVFTVSFVNSNYWVIKKNYLTFRRIYFCYHQQSHRVLFHIKLKTCVDRHPVCFCSCLHYVKGRKPAGRIQKWQRQGKKPLHVSKQECVLPLYYDLKGYRSICLLLSLQPHFGIFGVPLCLCITIGVGLRLLRAQWHPIATARGIRVEKGAGKIEQRSSVPWLQDWLSMLGLLCTALGIQTS